ncbi:hypothetical protein R9C00_06815 [Flammeovirgaceae bacterium SG7u.111]|nr:hypothetical protein [Flammeovirgaceae bacterium SG7u.132]WPO37154.1 hypothetical protein R9C00_06815 [Flammeovirgaceae bacterium SG7u.111]
MKKSKVLIKENDKPIQLEVQSGYSILGGFSLTLYTDNEKSDLYPERAKSLTDRIVDIFLLPPVDVLLESKLYIYGVYGPAPTHSQIFISYNFLQEDIELKVLEKKSNQIEESISTASKRYHNSFSFEKETV